MIEISFPGLTMFGGSIDPLRGFVVKDGGLSGFEDLPDGDAESPVRPQAHGTFDLPIFRRARLVSISGYAFAGSGFDLAHMRDQLVGIGADGGQVEFALTDGGGTRAAVGRVLSCKMPQHGRDNAVRWAPFSLSIECRDPRLYGEEHSVTGPSVAVSHYGNFPASPVIAVAGPRSAPYTISGPAGRTVTVTQPLSSAQSHRIDFRAGRVYRNGVLQVGVLGRADVWMIPPGQQIQMSITSGAMTVTVTDTYM